MAPAIDRLTPINWGNTLSGQPILDTRIGGAVPALVRRWQGIAPNIEQSSLDEHYLSIHLGGAKRLRRNGEGCNLVRDTEQIAHSFVPAGSAYQWVTEGPIDFAHFYFDPKTIDRFVANSFDRDPRDAELRACLGESEQLIDSLASAVLAELANGDGPQQAYLDDLMHLLLFQLLRRCSDAGSVATPNPHALAPHRLRIAIDFIEANLGQPIGVSEIAAAAGMSAFHFSRAFRQSTGAPPYAYLLGRRVAAAKLRLLVPGGSLAAIALECGFSSANQFSRMFKNATGLNPSCYRSTR